MIDYITSLRSVANKHDNLVYGDYKVFGFQLAFIDFSKYAITPRTWTHQSTIYEWNPHRFVTECYISNERTIHENQ